MNWTNSPNDNSDSPWFIGPTPTPGASGPQSANSFGSQYRLLERNLEKLRIDAALKDKQIKELKTQLSSVSDRAKKVIKDAKKGFTGEVAELKSQVEEAVGASKEDFGTELKNLRNEIDSLKQASNSAQDEIKTQKAELKSDRLQSIQTLAIFVGFFTFTSISFQMFANVNKAYWMPLGLLILGAVMLFATITAVFSLWSQKKVPKILKRLTISLIIVAILSVAGGSYLYVGALDNENVRQQACRDLIADVKTAEQNDTKEHWVVEEQYRQECIAGTR